MLCVNVVVECDKYVREKWGMWCVFVRAADHPKITATCDSPIVVVGEEGPVREPGTQSELRLPAIPQGRGGVVGELELDGRGCKAHAAHKGRGAGDQRRRSEVGRLQNGVGAKGIRLQQHTMTTLRTPFHLWMCGIKPTTRIATTTTPNLGSATARAQGGGARTPKTAWLTKST